MTDSHGSIDESIRRDIRRRRYMELAALFDSNTLYLQEGGIHINRDHYRPEYTALRNAIKKDDPAFYEALLKDECLKIKGRAASEGNMFAEQMQVMKALEDMGVVHPHTLDAPTEGSFMKEFMARAANNMYWHMEKAERRRQYVVVRDMCFKEAIEEKFIEDFVHHRIKAKEMNNRITSYYNLINSFLPQIEEACAAQDPQFYTKILKDRYVTLRDSLQKHQPPAGVRGAVELKASHALLEGMEKKLKWLGVNDPDLMPTPRREGYATLFAESDDPLPETERKRIEDVMMDTLEKLYPVLVQSNKEENAKLWAEKVETKEAREDKKVALKPGASWGGPGSSTP